MVRFRYTGNTHTHFPVFSPNDSCSCWGQNVQIFQWKIYWDFLSIPEKGLNPIKCPVTVSDSYINKDGKDIFPDSSVHRKISFSFFLCIHIVTYTITVAYLAACDQLVSFMHEKWPSIRIKATLTWPKL